VSEISERVGQFLNHQETMLSWWSKQIPQTAELMIKDTAQTLSQWASKWTFSCYIILQIAPSISCSSKKLLLKNSIYQNTQQHHFAITLETETGIELIFHIIPIKKTKNMTFLITNNLHVWLSSMSGWNNGVNHIKLLTISTKMQPRLHTSTAVEYNLLPSRISGARYHNVITWQTSDELAYSVRSFTESSEV